MLAGMKIGEGILRYCPATDLINKYKSNKGESEDPLI